MSFTRQLCILLTSLLALSCQAEDKPAIQSLDDLPEVSNEWVALDLRFLFYEKKYSTQNITFFHTMEPIYSTQFDHKLAAGSVELAAPIWAPATENPFRHLYPDVYRRFATGHYDDCEFTGVQFELDDNPLTKEWNIVFEGELCTYGQNVLSKTPDTVQVHGWVVQRTEQGDYRILMENNDILFIKIQNTQYGYKSMETLVRVPYLHREAYQKEMALPFNERKQLTTPHCGRGLVHWEYQGSQYQPVRLRYAGGCSAHYQRSAESDDKFLRRMQTPTTQYLLNWLGKVTGRPMQMDEQGYLLPRN